VKGGFHENIRKSYKNVKVINAYEQLQYLKFYCEKQMKLTKGYNLVLAGCFVLFLYQPFMFLPIMISFSQIWAYQSPQNFFLAIVPIVMAILGLIGRKLGKTGKKSVSAVLLLIAGISAIISLFVLSIAYYGYFSIFSFLSPLGFSLLGGILVLVGAIMISLSKDQNQNIELNIV
jgi:hypothetical protein